MDLQIVSQYDGNKFDYYDPGYSWVCITNRFIMQPGRTMLALHNRAGKIIAWFNVKELK